MHAFFILMADKNRTLHKPSMDPALHKPSMDPALGLLAMKIFILSLFSEGIFKNTETSFGLFL